MPLGLAVALSVGARFMPAQVEQFYSRGLYPRIAGLVDGPARSWTEKHHTVGLVEAGPSLAEVILLGVVVLSFVLLVHGFFRGIGTVIRRCLWIVGTASLLFVGSWGLNHAREPLSMTLGLEVAAVEAGDLDQIAGEMSAALSQMLAVPALDVNRSTVPRRTAEAWAEALEREPDLGWQPHALVVGPQLSGMLVTAGISGIFSPFTQEAHVAVHLPEADVLFTACHEIAHVQGWAREDEANYLAWRVASRSDDGALRRAALIIALSHVHSALERADKELMAKRWHDLDPLIKEQFAMRSEFWARERSVVAVRAASGVNDAYLRSQGQPGIASYGRMVDLIVAEWKSGGLPAW